MEITEKSLGELACKYCKMFVDNKCSGEDSQYHEDEKEILVELALDKFKKIGDNYSKHWAENINDYYVCEEFKEKIEKKV